MLQPVEASDRTPVTVISGFLGSGKTTLVNRILRDARFKHSVVIVNEFGEVGLDHDLIETSLDDPVLLKSGCVCCSIRGDLRDTLMSLRLRVRGGTLQRFSRVFVETSGVADPGPVLQTLFDDSALMASFAPDALIVTVDAVHGRAQIARFAEAAKQVSLADRIIVTKADLASAAQVEATRMLLRELNPSADIRTAGEGEHDSAVMMQHAHGQIDTRTPLDASVSHGFAAHVVRRREPVDWARFSTWLQSLVSLRGSELLRLKGLVHVAQSERPVLVQAVHHAIYPPSLLAGWPDDQRGTRLVLIANSGRLADVQRAMDAALA